MKIRPTRRFHTGVPVGLGSGDTGLSPEDSSSTISPLELLLTEWSKFFPEQKIARFRTLSNDEAEDLILALPAR